MSGFLHPVWEIGQFSYLRPGKISSLVLISEFQSISRTCSLGVNITGWSQVDWQFDRESGMSEKKLSRVLRELRLDIKP